MPKDDRLYVTVALDLPNHHKLIGAPPDAKWLSVCGFIVARRDLSDGVIKVSAALAEAEVQKRHATDLISRGMWHEKGHDCDRCEQPPPGRVIIHDYLEHNQSRAEVDAYRAKKSESGRKGAASRWHGNRDSTRHSKSNGKPDGKAHGEPVAKGESEKEPGLSKSYQSPLLQLDDDGLTRVEQITKGDRGHAQRTAAMILDRAPETVRDPTAYVLAAIRDDPDTYRHRRGNPTKFTECPQHPGQWPDTCSGCAADQLVDQETA